MDEGEKGGKIDVFSVVKLTGAAINVGPNADEITLFIPFLYFHFQFQSQLVYFLDKGLLDLIDGKGLATLDAASGTMIMFDPKPHRLMTVFGEACAAHKTGTLYRVHLDGILERPIMVHHQGSGEKGRATREIA